MKTKYFSIGSMSEKEGMTFIINIYDDESGDLLTGKPENQMYKKKEITKEEFDEYTALLKNSSVRGLAGGLLNEEGRKALKEHWKNQYEEWLKNNESKIALTVKKIKKQLDLGIIEQTNIDTEIELNGMKEFAEIIKERVAQ